MIQTIETERLFLRRIRAAKSVYAQYDRPNDLDDVSVQTRVARLSLFAEAATNSAIAFIRIFTNRAMRGRV